MAAFFGASTACAAFVNKVSDGIAQQLAEFGADLGLVAPQSDGDGDGDGDAEVGWWGSGKGTDTGTRVMVVRC